MPAEKYTKAYLTKQLPAKIREHLRSDNLDTTRLPSYEYLESKGFHPRGLTKAIQRHFDTETTLNEFLRQQGFGYEDSDWPTEHEETINHLNGFYESRKERNNDRDATLSSIKSALREVLRTVQKLHNTDNLLSFARYDTEAERHEANEQIEEIIDHLKHHYSDGTAENYVRYFKEFYNYVDPRTRIDQNPVREVEGQYKFDSSPDSDVEPLNYEQIKILWQTVKQLPERTDITESVKDLAERYGLGQWQVYMMVLLLLGVAVGMRSIEYVRTDCQEEWKLDEEYIEVPKRKNLPGEVPVLAHPNFLEAFCRYMDEINDDWNGKPFPNPDNGTGSRTKNTLNNWLAALCEEADVRLEDGSTPTLQNLRQTWHTDYLKVLRVNDVRLQLVADEAGTKDPDQIRNSYRSKKEERKSIRALVTEELEELLPLSELPDEMSNVIDETEHIETQTSIEEF